jgi:hypothetical protein
MDADQDKRRTKLKAREMFASSYLLSPHLVIARALLHFVLVEDHVVSTLVVRVTAHITPVAA